MLRRLLLTCVLLITALPSYADEARDTAKAAAAAYKLNDYAQSAALYAKAVKLDPRNQWSAYNGACSYALAGDNNSALLFLSKAMDLGYREVKHLEDDRDLTSLHADARWASLVERARGNQTTFDALYRSTALAVPFSEQLSTDEKLAGLAKYWSEVKYNLLDEDILKRLDWDSVLLAYLPKVRATTSTAEYYQVMAALAHQIGDSNTGVWPPTPLEDATIAAPPFYTRLLEGRLIIQDVFDEKLHEHGVVPGVEVVSVDGVAALAYAREVSAPLQFFTTEPIRTDEATSSFFLRGDIKKQLRVRFAREDGSQFELLVQRIPAQEFLRQTNFGAGPLLTAMEGNIAYVRILNLYDTVPAELRSRAAEWQNSKALIIDLRESTGGSDWSAQQVLEMLMPAPFEMQGLISRAHRSLDLLGENNSAPFIPPPELNAPHATLHYNKPVFVLISPRTSADGEMMVRTMNRYHRGTSLGEPTGAGKWSLVVPLPGGGRGFVGTVAANPAPGEPLQQGVTPTVTLGQSVADMRRGVDTVLEAALFAARSGAGK